MGGMGGLAGAGGAGVPTGGLGKLGGLLGARKAMAGLGDGGLEALAERGGDPSEALAAMMAGRGGAAPAGPPPVAPRVNRGTGKKKKGGRVTPPKRG
jgi:hypothetical protein